MLCWIPLACAGEPGSDDATSNTGSAPPAPSNSSLDQGPDTANASGLGPSESAGSSPGSDASAPDAGATADPVDPALPGSRVLLFAAFNQTWWAEYKVIYEGLRAAGYSVDVRSSTTDPVAMSYGEAVDATPQGVPGTPPLPYQDFAAAFEANFGQPWDPAWNRPADIPLDGRIQDAQMSDYVALVVPGGSGSQSYRYDGEYEELANFTGFPEHVSLVADVASAAQSLNDLVVAALVQGAPVLAVCHAAPTPGFARVPGSEGQGPDELGISILHQRAATGFPLPNNVFGATGDVNEQYAALGIEFLPAQAVVVDGPNVDLGGDSAPDGADLVVTGRSWYPEEVVLGLRATLDLLE